MTQTVPDQDVTRRIRLRRDTAANWTARNPTLLLGEPGVEQRVGPEAVKIGDGINPWNALPYTVDPSSSGGGGSGQALTFVAQAGQVLSGHRAVRAGADGRMVYADRTDALSAVADLFITNGAADLGAAVTVTTAGLMYEAGWSWTPGRIWLGLNGLLTQVQPTTALLRQIGTADGPNGLYVNPQPPLVLA